MNIFYKHTQKGFYRVFIFGCIMLFIALLTIYFHRQYVLSFILFILVLALFLFSSLTTCVTDKYVKIWFGAGLIHRKFLLSEIHSVRIAKTPWYYGWGIRCIPEGLLFNVKGNLSIELQMKNGKIYRIGTDEAEKLKQAIVSALNNM